MSDLSKWIDEGALKDGSRFHWYKCSGCGGHIISTERMLGSYSMCPNCGKEMELEDPREGRWKGYPDRTRTDFRVHDVVRHFKHETVSQPDAYLYEIVAFAEHTESHEKLVVYRAITPPYKVCARPYKMFISEVDKDKYPDIEQKYRFELVEPQEEEE